MNQNKLIRFTVLLLGVMFYAGIAVLIALPLLIKLAGRYYSSAITDVFWQMLFTYALSGICGITIVYQLRKMMKTVVEQNCFVEENTASLKLMGKVSFVICALFILKLFFFVTPATFVIILTFFIAGIFSHVLSCVFQEAVRYKTENDLTI